MSIAVKIQGTCYPIKNIFYLVSSSLTQTHKTIATISQEFFKDLTPSAHAIIKLSYAERGIEEILNILSMQDFFSPRRLIILSDIANLNTEATKQICDFVKNDATILIGLISATPEKHKWSYEELEITKIELKHLNSIEKLNYIKKSFLHNGLKIANDKICQIIFNLANSDIDQIDQYVQLITLYAEEGSLITEEMIRILYPENLESDEFKFIQVIAKGNYYQIAHYVTILQQTQANFFGLVGLLFKNYSQLHQIAHLQSLHLSTNDIAKQIGSPPWLVEKHLKILNSYKNEINFLPHLLRIMQSSLELRSKSLPHSELMLDLALYLRPKSVNDGANGSRLSKI